MKKIKLLWDFRGPEAKRIAEHHIIHLEEYATAESLEDTEVGTSQVSPMYCIAYMIVQEKDMNTCREALKPHRGQIAS